MANAAHETDVVIIGAGPVGLFSVFELGMLKVRAHVVDTLDAVGGQCTALYPEKPIYDIPGYPEIEAQELIKNLEAQAAPFEPTYHLGQQVTALTKTDMGWQVTTSRGTKIHCSAVMIAAGCGAFGPNRPPLEGLERYEATGGVQYLVTQKEKFRGKNLVIAGGGDSALDWANALADIAGSVSLVHRRDKFRAMPESVDKMRSLVAAGKIDLVVPYQLAGLEGEDTPLLTSPRERGEEKREALGGGKRLTGVIVKTLDGEAKTLPADYLLPFYGLAMELGPIAEWDLNISHNHIAIDPRTCATNTDGIFAIGDIATYEKKLKLILCGFSEAALAAHAIRDIVYPDTAYHFEYSTTSGVPA